MGETGFDISCASFYMYLVVFIWCICLILRNHSFLIAFQISTDGNVTMS